VHGTRIDQQGRGDTATQSPLSVGYILFSKQIQGAGHNDGWRQAMLKRVAIFQIRSLRFRSFFYRMSSSQNRFTLLRDML